MAVSNDRCQGPKEAAAILSDCATCFHPKENHKPIDGAPADSYISHICTGALDCRCEHYAEPYLVEFAQEIEKVKHERKTIFDRVLYILTNIPQTRNASQKTFGKIYNEIWHGMKIRVVNSNVTQEVWNRTASWDSINREVRRAKREVPTLATYDPKVIKKHEIIFQAYMELAAGT